MSKKLWGGRFTKPTDTSVEEFTKSIHYDYKLAKYDILGSIVHVERDRVLVATGLGQLSLVQVQPAGKRPMTIQEFLRGYPLAVGQRLGVGKGTGMGFGGYDLE